MFAGSVLPNLAVKAGRIPNFLVPSRPSFDESSVMTDNCACQEYFDAPVQAFLIRSSETGFARQIACAQDIAFSTIFFVTARARQNKRSAIPAIPVKLPFFREVYF